MNETEYIYQLEKVVNGGSSILGKYTTLHQAMNTGRTPLDYGEWIESDFSLLYIRNNKDLPLDRAYDIIRSTHYHIERRYKFDSQRVCTESFKLPSQ